MRRISKLAIFILSVAILYKLVSETFRPRVVRLGLFSVPKAFEDAGYTPEAIDNQIVDQVINIENHARTARKDNFSVPDSQSMLDVEVPATGLSFKTVVEILQDFLRLEPLRVSGEIVLMPNAVSKTAGSHESSQHLAITTRFSHSDSDRRSTKDEIPTTSPQAAINVVAQEILRYQNPFILGLYANAVEKDPAKAIQLFETSIKEDPTLADPHNNLGRVLLNQGNIKGAIEQFRKCIDLDHKSALAYNN